MRALPAGNGFSEEAAALNIEHLCADGDHVSTEVEEPTPRRFGLDGVKSMTKGRVGN